MNYARQPIVDSSPCPYDWSWRQVRELDADVAQVVSLVAGASLCIASLVLWLLFVPFKPVKIDYVALIAAMALVVVLHELSHALAFICGRGRSLRVEFVWRNHRPQLRYQGAVSRTHYLAVLAAPLVVVSLLPIAAAALVPLRSGDLVLVSLLNSLVSGADFVAAGLLMLQVPAGALVRRQSDSVLWKAPAGSVGPAPAPAPMR